MCRNYSYFTLHFNNAWTPENFHRTMDSRGERISRSARHYARDHSPTERMRTFKDVSAGRDETNANARTPIRRISTSPFPEIARGSEGSALRRNGRQIDAIRSCFDGGEIRRRTENRDDSSSTGRRDDAFRRRFLLRATRASARLARIIPAPPIIPPPPTPLIIKSASPLSLSSSLSRGKNGKSSGTLGGAITNYLREHASWAGTGNIAGR